jgi:hypothetical protein
MPWKECHIVRRVRDLPEKLGTRSSIATKDCGCVTGCLGLQALVAAKGNQRTSRRGRPNVYIRADLTPSTSLDANEE